jgi:hypothetical protein
MRCRIGRGKAANLDSLREEDSKVMPMRTRTHPLTLIAALVGLVYLADDRRAIAQATDPAVGSWVLNYGKSVFNPENTLQRRTATFEGAPDGFKHIQLTLLANGSTSRIEYTVKFDGKDHPIAGSALDTVAVKRIDANTVERTGKVGGKIVETATRTVSADGKTLTITTKGNLDGTEYSSTQVFEKQS